jgi:hypothetical protein
MPLSQTARHFDQAGKPIIFGTRLLEALENSEDEIELRQWTQDASAGRARPKLIAVLPKAVAIELAREGIIGGRPAGNYVTYVMAARSGSSILERLSKVINPRPLQGGLMNQA